MIRNSADLLEKFIEKESEFVNKQKMPHMPTLGSAYEQITLCGLSEKFVLPDGLNLKVVSGFIKIGEKIIHNQIDCMLVTGDGERFGLTDNYYYDISQVLVIFEVKKTMNKKELVDSYEHLSDIKQEMYDYFYNELHEVLLENKDKKIVENYHKIVDVVCDEIDDDMNSVILINQNMEMVLPLHIIQGYAGYNTEYGLRNSFVDFLSKRIGKKGYGVSSMPNLIMVGNLTIVKTTGFPYFLIDNDNYIPMASCNNYSCWIMLELIWDKISRYFNVSLPYFDKDLELEQLVPLMKAKILRKGDKYGWCYGSYDYKQKEIDNFRSDSKQWEPQKLSQPAVSILNVIFLLGKPFVFGDKDYEKFATEYAVSLEDIIFEITSTTYFRREDNMLFMITKDICFVETDDGNSWIFMKSETAKFYIWMKENGLKPVVTYTSIY